METFKHIATYPIMGMPAWAALLTLVVIPLVNEWIQRRKSMKAQSLMQAVGNVIKSTPVVGKVPGLKQVADAMATPAQPTIEQPEVK